MPSDTPDLAVVIDSFEQKMQRPKDHHERGGFYSGTKKTQTLKSHVAVNDDMGAIVDVSDSVASPTVDINLLEQSGLMKYLPDSVSGIGNLVYEEIENLHPQGKGACPRHKPRGKPRSPEDVAYNTASHIHQDFTTNLLHLLSVNHQHRKLTCAQTNHQHSCS